MKSVEQLSKEKILIIDGAMGTQIQQYKLSEEDFRGSQFRKLAKPQKGNNDLLCITNPHIIKQIHKNYLLAGADIIETNTFNANRISMTDYGAQHIVEEINIAAVTVAKQAIAEVGKNAFVAGAIGPTSKTCSISPHVHNPAYRDVDFDTMVQVYEEQAQAMLSADVDILLVETIFDTLNAKAAFFAIQNVFQKTGKSVPLMASGTITDNSGRTLSGQTTEAFLVSLSHIPLFSIGLNCALGTEQMIPYIEILSKNAPINISAYPNAGLPNALGNYDETPESMAKQVEILFQKKLVNIVGGCCGTSPAHIRAIAEIANQYKPRRINSPEKQTT